MILKRCILLNNQGLRSITKILTLQLLMVLLILKTIRTFEEAKMFSNCKAFIMLTFEVVDLRQNFRGGFPSRSRSKRRTPSIWTETIMSLASVWKDLIRTFNGFSMHRTNHSNTSNSNSSLQPLCKQC